MLISTKNPSQYGELSEGIENTQQDLEREFRARVGDFVYSREMQHDRTRGKLDKKFEQQERLYRLQTFALIANHFSTMSGKFMGNLK